MFTGGMEGQVGVPKLQSLPGRGSGYAGGAAGRHAWDGGHATGSLQPQALIFYADHSDRCCCLACIMQRIAADG